MFSKPNNITIILSSTSAHHSPKLEAETKPKGENEVESRWVGSRS